jgi:membrane dipeptidase
MSEFGVFPLSLDPAKEERALRMHASSLVIDLLYWGPMTYQSFDADMEKVLRASYDQHRSAFMALAEAHALPLRMATSKEAFPQMRSVFRDSGITGGQFPMMVGDPNQPLCSASQLNRAAERLEWVRKVTTAQDFVDAKNADQLAWSGWGSLQQRRVFVLPSTAPVT